MGEFSVACDQQVDFTIVTDIGDNESGGRRVEQSVAGFFRLLLTFVKGMQGPDESRLRRDTPRVLKVVEEDRLGAISDPHVELVVIVVRQIELFPEEITLLECHFLWQLGPIAAGFQGVDDVFGIVTFAHGESKILSRDCTLWWGSLGSLVRAQG